jgi:hypothetical protein
MGRPLPTDAIGSPTRWLIVFDRKAASWWADLVALGRYKHVRAFGYVHDLDAYVFYDVQFAGTTLQLARGDGARRLMVEWTANADVLAMDAIHPITPRVIRPFRPLICTTAVAHLLGLGPSSRWCLPGALLLRPDAFYRACLRYGATPVGGAHGEPVHSHDHGSRDVSLEGG